MSDAIARDAPDTSSRRFLTPHNCFACGELNEHGVHLAMYGRNGRSRTELTVAGRFEGWDGITHGGIIATILDEVMAWSLVDEDAWGVTARMTVQYRRPIPVGTHIRAEGWITKRRRKLIDAAGRIVDADSGLELATSEAVYVAAPEERQRELKAKYGYRPVLAPGVGADPEAQELEARPGTPEPVAR